MIPTAKVALNDPGVWKLAEFLSFSPYLAGPALGAAFEPVLDKLGLSYPDYFVIAALWDEDNQSVSSLVGKLFLASDTLPSIMKKLETMGYVRNQRDPDDARQLRASLTDAGRRLRQDLLAMSVAGRTGPEPKQVSLIQRAMAHIRDTLLQVFWKHAKMA